MRPRSPAQYVESLHGARPWGRVLDAGTGVHSLGWVGALEATSVVAVTGDEAMQRDLEQRSNGRLSSPTELVCGNWNDDAFLQGRQFDVILADYRTRPPPHAARLLTRHSQSLAPWMASHPTSRT